MSDIPKRLQNSLSRIVKSGGVILIHHPCTSASLGTALSYHLRDGREVSAGVVHKLKDAGRLKSGQDGLFPGAEQTLHVVAA